MSIAANAPLVFLPACQSEKEGQVYHTIGDKYVRAVATAAGCLPVMLPSLGELYDADAVVQRADGIVLTGSPSNVHPTAYGDAEDPRAEPYDTWRDTVTLPLIRAALAAGCPLLAICRGMQELNVALGGTLHPRVHEIEGRRDHRRPQDPDLDVQYGEVHDATLTPGGILANLLGQERIRVNSLHWQGIADPAPDLRIEARADDGTVEAVSLPGARGFVLGVQWHPEYKPQGNRVSMAIFEAFAKAARARAAGRLGV
jgi:putative glutamine amidotransferase